MTNNDDNDNNAGGVNITRKLTPKLVPALLFSIAVLNSQYGVKFFVLKYNASATLTNKRKSLEMSFRLRMYLYGFAKALTKTIKVPMSVGISLLLKLTKN